MGENGWSSTSEQQLEIRGLALSEPLVIFLAEDLLKTDTEKSITVEYPEGHPKRSEEYSPTSGFSRDGFVIIGKEIIGYGELGAAGNTFTDITRGAFGTEIEDHYKGDQVTDKAYFFKVKALSSLAGETPAKWGVLKIDLSAPSEPTDILPGPAKAGAEPAIEGKYEITWVHAKDYESGVALYEIQERIDTNPVWKTIDVVSGDKFSINVGDGAAQDVDGEDLNDESREQGHFYYYRIRARNAAGSWGAWSEASPATPTGLPDRVISNVSNFPNPVDTRRGGEEGKTNIVYILNQDAEVTITLYDLLGYKVFEWNFSPGSNGGKKGANRIPWDGSNEAGQKVSKGGYIAHIKVKSDRGVITAIRKIGIIH
jgi:hypothetical protein